jgi:NAD(P)-dependent dehydrogenase (short-subunit alcohol dehydrogenase family)
MGETVSLSSTRGLSGAKCAIAYSTSKSGLLGMPKTLAMEYGRFNITSNIISLGYFQYGMMEKISTQQQEQMKMKFLQRNLLMLVTLPTLLNF